MERIFMRMEKKLNSNHLKIIAIIAMTIDHATDLFYPAFPAQPLPIALHILGRLTAPIMWFFVAEGYYYTRNVLNKFFNLPDRLQSLPSHTDGACDYDESTITVASENQAIAARL